MTIFEKKFPKFLFAALILISPKTFAIVEMLNANYNNKWIDIEVPGNGYEMNVTRSYNSRSLLNGIFGFGWCSDFETKLVVTAEGNLRIRHCGAGAITTYSAKEISRGEIDKTISRIVMKMKSENKVGRNDAFYKNLQTELVDDDIKRFKLAKDYGITTPIKEGTKFFANGKEVEFVTLQKNYYVREFGDGNAQRFDLEGRLIAMYDKTGNFLKFEYDKEQLREIVDNSNRKMTFKYYPNHKVKTINAPNGLKAEYAFSSNLDDLISATDSQNKVNKYEYDDQHNLTKAVFPDKKFITLKYDKKRDWVIGFTDRDGCNETYDYELSSDDPKNHYSSAVKKTCGKNVVASNKYEFWYKNKSGGQSYLYKTLAVVDGITTEIINHETFGKPISIRRNLDKATYEYYNNGLIKTKSTPAANFTYEYEDPIKKVSKVNQVYYNDKGKVIAKKTSEFKYDGKGFVTSAKNSDGQMISVTYDDFGRMLTITDQSKKTVLLAYDGKATKPARIQRKGFGMINVTYKANGEIATVESKDGPNIALQVASLFNNLIDVVQPASAEVYL